MANDRTGGKTALVKAVDFLSRQDYSRKNIAEKLRRSGYEDEEIDSAVERLEEKGYLNDENLCKRQFMAFYEGSRKSVREICLKLMERGFSSSLVRECVPVDTYERELRTAGDVLRRKYRRSIDAKKMMGYLYRHGFSGNVCRDAVDFFMEENEHLEGEE